jgi:hypothetical protein
VELKWLILSALVVGANARRAEEPAAKAVDAAKLPVQKTEESAKNAAEEAREASLAANKAAEAAKDWTDS